MASQLGASWRYVTRGHNPLPLSKLIGKVHRFHLKDISFDMLQEDRLIALFKDGRVFSHFIEVWADQQFSALSWVKDARGYDFVEEATGQKVDEKTFTKAGCRFCPSSMIGCGRHFDQKVFDAHAAELVYMLVDNTDFPNISVRFERGSSLATAYPKGTIPHRERDKLFGARKKIDG